MQLSIPEYLEYLPEHLINKQYEWEMYDAQGNKVEEEEDIQIDLKISSYIPDEFIENSSLKIEIYQNIALCKNEEDIQNVIDELIDRFGNMPYELENLLNIARIKYLSKPLYISKIMSKGTSIVFIFEQSTFNIDIQKLIDVYKNKIKFSPGIKPMITLQIANNNEKEILRSVTDFLKELIQGGDYATNNQ